MELVCTESASVAVLSEVAVAAGGRVGRVGNVITLSLNKWSTGLVKKAMLLGCGAVHIVVW